jgi:hypothetical protein
MRDLMECVGGWSATLKLSRNDHLSTQVVRNQFDLTAIEASPAPKPSVSPEHPISGIFFRMTLFWSSYRHLLSSWTERGKDGIHESNFVFSGLVRARANREDSPA